MRVLVTADPELPVPPLLYGGIERVIEQVVRQLQVNGHEVALVANRESRSAARTVFAWPGAVSGSRVDAARNVFALLSAVRSFRPDVLHSFSRLAYMTPLLRSKLPKVMSYQRQPTRSTVGLAAWLARPGTLTFTGCSESIAAAGRAGGGQWIAIHNCIDPQRLRFNASVRADAPLVFLSRVERIKGVHTAIEIARRAGKRLLIAGNHSATPDAAEYWEGVIRPRIGRDGIEYVGPVNDEQKSDLLSNALAMVVPIEWDEPFGIVFAEALACGTPVISTPRGALPEIVRDGIDGFLVNSVEEGVSAVGKVVALDRAACRDRAISAFSVEKITSDYVSLYSRATERPLERS